MCKAGIAKADPIMVWGRVNLQRTRGKGTFLVLLEEEDSSGMAGTVPTFDAWRGPIVLGLRNVISGDRGESLALDRMGRGVDWKDHPSNNCVARKQTPSIDRAIGIEG